MVLDPRIAPRDQATWAFTDDEDAMAMAGFLNARVGGGEEIAWVEVVPLARKTARARATATPKARAIRKSGEQRGQGLSAASFLRLEVLDRRVYRHSCGSLVNVYASRSLSLARLRDI